MCGLLKTQQNQFFLVIKRVVTSSTTNFLDAVISLHISYPKPLQLLLIFVQHCNVFVTIFVPVLHTYCYLCNICVHLTLVLSISYPCMFTCICSLLWCMTCSCNMQRFLSYNAKVVTQTTHITCMVVTVTYAGLLY